MRMNSTIQTYHARVFSRMHCCSRSALFFFGIQSSLAIQAFKFIFTLPGSVEFDRQINDDGTIAQPLSEPARKQQRFSDKRCIHSHVAALLGMKAITPQSIVYAAVQVGMI